MTREKAYKVLGISPDVSPDDAKKAYRSLVKIYHPDKNPASNAAYMFQLVQDAWECIQDDLEEMRAKAAKARAEETTEFEFKKGIEKLRRLCEEAKTRIPPEWNAERRAHEAYDAYIGRGNPPLIELQGRSKASDGEFCEGIDDLRCNRSYKKVSVGNHKAYICQSEGEADEVLIDGINCTIRLYPNVLERIVLLRHSYPFGPGLTTYRDGIYKYIKTRELVNGELRDVYVHLQFKLKDTHGGVFPDLIHGVNAIILEIDENEAIRSGHFEYIKKLNTSDASKWVHGERPQTLPEGLPRVAFRVSRYRDVGTEIKVDDFPFIYRHPVEMPDSNKLAPHRYSRINGNYSGWRASWEKKSVVWSDGVRRDSYRRSGKQCDEGLPDSLTLTGNPLEPSEDGKYPDLVDGVNCHVKIFD